MVNVDGTLQTKLNNMTEKAIADLNKELHPNILGEMLKMEHPIIKLVTISKYEGYGLALKELGADTKNLEILIDNETDKIEPDLEKLIT